MSNEKTWFVTGASKGLGLALVKKLIDQGYRVAATSRNAESFQNEVEHSTRFLPLEVDITNEASVQHAIAETLAKFGQIDVVVNNAGYGQLGTLEELSDAEARENFEVNVFGSLNVIRAVMPQLRKQKAGHILNISSVGGILGTFPGWGVYCATKFAVAGFTEALAEEVKEFGIHATVVYPGYFRTDFLTGGSLKLPQNTLAEYTEARASEQAHKNSINGNQPNDPEKAAEAMIAVSERENPPVHLLLGIESIGLLEHKVKLISEDAKQWKSYTESTGF